MNTLYAIAVGIGILRPMKKILIAEGLFFVFVPQIPFAWHSKCGKLQSCSIHFKKESNRL